MKKAFTLIELIVVVAIIGVLATVLLSSFSGGTESARAAKCLNNMRSLAQASISYRMKNRHYPAAGSCAEAYPSSGDGEEHFEEVVGWISWFSQGNPYKAKPTSFINVPTVSAYSQNDDEALFALTNGAIWTTMNRNRASYVCPLHTKTVSVRPNWSYVMNACFGYDDSNGSDATSTVPEDSHSRLDRRLLFTELPFGSEPDSEAPDYSTVNNNPKTDCTLQYKATINGKSYNQVWSGTAETIAYNHKSGKNGYCAHVVYADGHTEKLLKPKSDAGLTREQLTAALCEALDISFDGKQYQVIEGGDEF